MGFPLIGAMPVYNGAFSAHFSRSCAENCQGAPLFSMVWKMAFSPAGAADSSITRYLRISRMTAGWLMLIGHSCAQALQVMHAHNSSSLMKSRRSERLSENSLPFLAIPGPFSRILARMSMMIFRGDSCFPVILAGQTEVHRPHSVQDRESR
jgi:hypothetical protein